METKTNLEKWIEGSLSSDERKEYEASKEFQEVSDLIKEAKKHSAPAFDTEVGYERLREKLTSKSNEKVISIGRNGYWAIAASILLVIAATFAFVRLVSQDTVFEGPMTAYLPDSTKVILHQATQLSFSESSWNENRNVELEGEAFFDVRKGSKFTVNSSKGTVSVLGTEFNVKSRPYEFSVECFEGKVSVTSAGENTLLLAGEGILLDENNSLTPISIAGNQPDWISGTTKFNSVRLATVLRELETIYEIEINENNLDTKVAFTGSLPNDNLDRALYILTASTKSSYSIEGNRVIINAAKAD